MDEPGIQAIVGVILGIVVGALFSAVNAGLNALGDVRLKDIRDEDGRYADVARRVLESRATIRARLLTGRVLGVTFAAAMAVWLVLEPFGLPAAAAAGAAVAFAYGAVAEVGATIARRRASRGALRMLWVLRPLELLLTPIALPLAGLGRLTERLVPEPPEPPPEKERITTLAMEDMIEQGEESGSIAEDHAQMLRSVLEFQNTVAREVMVPRTQMVAFELDTSIEDVVARIVESGHSRYPVYRDQADQVEGILYAKDLFRVLRERDGVDGISLSQLLRRPAFFVAETQKIGGLLREMQAKRFHLAVVVDEFGGVSGIVTLEDILEEIVGEIHDEHDHTRSLVEERSPDHYIVDAGISVYDLEEAVGETLRDEEGDFDSVGGMLVALCGRVPEVGETIEAGAFELRVLDADERRVTRVEMTRRLEQTAATA